MKELKGEATQTYNWWRDSGEDILDNHVCALREDAMDRIKGMIKEGFTSGELRTNVRMTDEDGEDGIEYTGWWTYSE